MQQQNTIQAQPPKFIRLNEVLARTGLASKSGLYALVQQEKFPRPIRISKRCSVWLESDVINWMQEKIITNVAA